MKAPAIKKKSVTQSPGCEAKDNAADRIFGHASRSSAPGSCGELWQGRLSDHPAHITCPIDIFSQASALIWPSADHDGRQGIDTTRVSRNSGSIDTDKTITAIKNYLTVNGLNFGLDVSISSSLVPGKGMASSTADITAAITAVAAALKITIADTQLAAIALGVDPTDGIFLPGISVFDHRGGRIARSLGDAPPIGIVILDFGGFIDSRTYASSGIEYSNEEMTKLLFAYELIAGGIDNSDPRAVGAGATISAFVNQKHLPKPALESVASYAKQLGAYGVNVAHSGAVIGVLVELTYLSDMAAKIKYRFPAAGLSLARLIGGGARDVAYEC